MPSDELDELCDDASDLIGGQPAHLSGAEVSATVGAFLMMINEKIKIAATIESSKGVAERVRDSSIMRL